MEEITTFESGPFEPEVGYNINPNATITSNRSEKIKENIISKNGYITDNTSAFIMSNNSGSIISNTVPYYLTPGGSIVGGLIFGNKVEKVILNNQIGRGGIVNNTSSEIIFNTAYGISNNRTRDITNNYITNPGEQDYKATITNNVINYDIINNTCKGIFLNIIKREIRFNNIDGFISNNKACEILYND